MKRLTALLALLFCAAQPFPVQAKPVSAQIGQASVKLALPKGYCVLDGKKTADARLIQLLRGAMQGTSELLLTFADCKQLKQWRSGKLPTLDDLGQYQTPVKAIAKEFASPVKPALSEVCASFKSNEGLFDSGSAPLPVEETIRQLVKGAQSGSGESHGVLLEEDNACYAWLLEKIPTEQGGSKIVAGVVTATVLKSKMVFLHVYAKFDGEPTVKKLLESARATVAAAHAANK